LKDSGKKIAFLFFLIFFFLSVALCTESSAQMVAGYPKKFHFSGLAQLQYKSYSFETSFNGSSYKNDYSHFEQHYNLNLGGYIYHPRLIVFNSSIYFTYLKSLTGVDMKGNDLTYNVFTTVLPYRPVSLELFGTREHSSFEAATSALPDRTINHYGARLKIKLEKREALKYIRLSYEHWDYITEGISEKNKTDAYSLVIRGFLSKIRTRYSLSYSISNYSSPSDRLDSKFFNLFTETGLTKKRTVLFMTFSHADSKYSGGNYTKESNFSANLSFPPGIRYYHDYMYLYNTLEQFYKGSLFAGTEDTLNESTNHLIKGSWGYRFTEKLMGSLSLDYGKRKINTESGKLTGISTGLSYSRTIAGLNFQSSYRFILKKDELRDDFNEHSLNVGLTRQVRFGTAYMHYYLIKSNSKSKVFEQNDETFLGEENDKIVLGERTTDTLSHVILLGIRGRGYGKVLGRAIWTIEGTYYTVESKIKKPIRSTGECIIDEFTGECIDEGFADDECIIDENTGECIDDGSSGTAYEEITRKRKQYSIYGQFFLPVRNSINLYSRARYSWGEIDSINRSSLIIDARLTYVIYRNITLTGLWRGRWDKIKGTPDRRTFDYEAELDYRRGRLLLSLEFYLTQTKQNNITNLSRRIFLTLKRYL